MIEGRMPKEKGGHEGASSMRPRAVRAIGVKVRVGISKVKCQVRVSGFYIIRPSMRHKGMGSGLV